VAHRVHLWVLAVLAYGVGDVGTTAIGLGIDGVVEANALLAPAVTAHGLSALVGWKLVAFGLIYAVARIVPRPYSIGCPAGLAIVGTVVTVWNVGIVLLGATT
jgi:hypothetical protein